MVFTIGKESTYKDAFSQAKAKGIEVTTLGMKRSNEDYPMKSKHPYGFSGAYVFQSRNDAMKFIGENQKDGFGVYGLGAEWNVDTYPSRGYWHYLMVDKPIFELDPIEQEPVVEPPTIRVA